MLTTPDGKSLPPAAYSWSQSPYRPLGLDFGCSIAQQCSAYLHSTTSITAGGDLKAGSIVPKGHTCAAYGTAVLTTSRNSDGSLKLVGSWPAAANRSNDYIADWFTQIFPTVWAGSTQRFKAYIRVRINAMVGIAQVYPEITISTGEDHTGQTGIDMCASIPADGRVMILETPHFAIGVGATTVRPSITIKPTTAASPANAYIDIDVLEIGLVPCMPETPHSFI